MSDHIQFLCPTCKAVMEAPVHRAGDKISCRKCGQRLQIPPPERSKTILAPRVCVDSDQPGPPPTVPTPEAAGISKEPITDNRSHRRRDTKTAAAENSAGSQSTADVQGGAGFSIASMITGILGALVSAVSSPAAIASLFIATFLLFLCPCIGIFGSALPVVAYCGVLLGIVLAAVAVITPATH